MPRNVFVLGLDDLNLESLRRMPGAQRYRFHQLLTIEELQQGEEIPLPELLAKAERQLRDFGGSIDAIVGYWDFPVSSMVPILAERFGTIAPRLEAVVKCEHKLWSRLEQQRVIKETPRFATVDPFDPESVRRLDLAFPYWIKPVKAFSSELAFRVGGPEDLERCLPEIRARIGRVGDPFAQVLSRLSPPAEIAEAGCRVCIAEEEVGGHQATVEGYHDGEARVHGIVDSITYPDIPSFQRFQYPSRLPADVQRRMADISRRVIARIGLEPATFNIEFFWDERTDEVWVLEVNPRHSQSHALLFECVDGAPNHLLMVQLALGEPAVLPYRRGRYRMAAKWFLRSFERDGVVRRAPSDAEVRAVERAVPGTAVKVIVRPGDRLSALHDQDAYSYKLANVYVGADSEEELAEKYGRCVSMLPIEVEAAGSATGAAEASARAATLSVARRDSSAGRATAL